MSYKLTIEDRGTFCIISGAFTNDDLINANNEIFKIPQFPDFQYEIIDFNNVTEYPIGSSAIRTVAEQDAELYKINPNIKLAIVANELVMTGLINMYRTYLEMGREDSSWDTEVFETIEQARKWLNA